MAETGSTWIPPNILRGLSDKLYDKRKVAALELEKLVREWISQRPSDFNDIIAKLIKLLSEDFINSHFSNLRNGGLIGLAAVAIALGPELISEHIDGLISPVLTCFQDMDSRGRYYACESLFNISKVARPHVLLHFPAIFDILSKLSADTDITVKNGAELLDRLMKGIITEEKSEHVMTYPLFTMDNFIILLKERMHTLNPHTRSFLVSWLSVLNSVPGIELLSYLADFLPGLFHFLNDANDHVRSATNQLLAELLHEISSVIELQKRIGLDPTSNTTGKPPMEMEQAIKEGESGRWQPYLNVSLDFPKLFQLLLPFLDSVQRDIQVTCLQWINEFIQLSNQIMAPFTAPILKFILPALASSDKVIKSTATTTHSLLLSLVSKIDTSQQCEISHVMDVLFTMLEHEFENTRMASLEWLIMLHPKSPQLFRDHPPFFTHFFNVLSDHSIEVLKLGLQLLIQIASVSTESQFEQLVSQLLSLFSKDSKLLETKGPLIVRQLCLALSAERVLQTFALVLEKESEMEFAATMVTNLNIILITSPELSNMRKQLRQFDAGGQNTYIRLYTSWCHSPMAVYSLCLLAEAYEHAYELLILLP
ncbi:hypothetical protein HMI56_006911 [Coelomomyces lativittatus]|nr:hypothetical protein HMI56_006911 [Coelomomyces lativittatus]